MMTAEELFFTCRISNYDSCVEAEEISNNLGDSLTNVDWRDGVRCWGNRPETSDRILRLTWPRVLNETEEF